MWFGYLRTVIVVTEALMLSRSRLPMIREIVEFAVCYLSIVFLVEVRLCSILFACPACVDWVFCWQSVVPGVGRIECSVLRVALRA